MITRELNLRAATIVYCPVREMDENAVQFVLRVNFLFFLFLSLLIISRAKRREKEKETNRTMVVVFVSNPSSVKEHWVHRLGLAAVRRCPKRKGTKSK